MKKCLLIIIALLLSVLVTPAKAIKAEGNQLRILTNIYDNDNVVKTFDQTVGSDSTTIPGLTISYESDASGDYFVVDVKKGATVNLSGFLTDEVENFIRVEGEDCGLKIIGKGTLNLIAKTNPVESDYSYKAFIYSSSGDICIGNSKGGPTITLTADLNDNDETPYDSFYGFTGRMFHLKNTTINVDVFSYLFNGIVEVNSIPVEERDILTLDHSSININYRKLNSYDTNTEKNTYLLAMDDPESFGNVILNNSKIKVVCEYNDVWPTDPSFIGQNGLANLYLNDSTIDANVKNLMTLAQTRLYETGCGAINASNGSVINFYSDNVESLAIVAESLNVTDSSLDIKTKQSPIWITGNNVVLEDSNINISIDSTEPLPLITGFGGDETNLSDDFVIVIKNKGVTKTWTKDTMDEFPKGEIEIEAKESKEKSNQTVDPVHVVLNTGVN